MNQIEPGYPKVMVHPAYAPAVLAKAPPLGAAGAADFGKPNEVGAPARFPPITVYKSDDEERERAHGYLVMGEPMPEHRPQYVEYPMMLIHPDHEDGIPEETKARREFEGGPIIYTKIEGKPEKWPPVTVNNSAEREVWEAKGYQMRRAPDPEAYLKATATPKPKHETIEPNEYPKFLKQFGKVVNNRDEENALLGIAPPNKAVLVPVEEGSEDSFMAIHPTAHEMLMKQIAALQAENAELKRKRGGRPKKIKLKPVQEQPAAE